MQTNNLRAIVYVSTAIQPFSGAELKALLNESRGLNLPNFITGLLLYSQGAFVQFFEGPSHATLDIYTRIRASRRHKDIVELMNDKVDARCFPDWSMGFTPEANSDLLALSTARHGTREHPFYGPLSSAPGLDLLQIFWKYRQPA